MADNIAQWLEELGLGQYVQAFAENGVELQHLRHLTDEDLKELGLPLGPRRQLQAAIETLSTVQPTIQPNADSAQDPGVPLAGAERRQLTVMFCDLVGSTALSSRLDLEDMRAVISAYHACCAELIERHDGFVAKYMGDGVLAYFGYPHAHEHDAEHAVQAGLSLVDAIPGLETTADSPLNVRIGIATGTVVVGDLVGSGDSLERGVVGETPNLAARLQSLADPGTVVIAEGTRRLVGNLFELEDLGSRNLKGIDGPVPAWRALREGSLESRFDALRGSGTISLVGREEESELLLRRWSRAKSGEGQIVLISGEAGIGKSHLTAALMAGIAEEPHTRLRYFCSPQHVDSVLHPVILQMERAANLVDTDTTQSRLDKLDSLLAETSTSSEDAGLLAEMLSLPNDGRYPALDLAPAQRRKMTRQAFVTQLEALAGRSPVLMIFEDAHWTDPTSLELFGHIVDCIADLPVLLIVTCRPEFKPPWIGRANVSALTLNRLADRQVRAMIDRVVGNRQLPASVRQDIIERTDGVPLFVEELTKAVLEAESDVRDERPAASMPSPAPSVPASLHASLTERLDRLGPAKEIVQIGAALGREFSHAMLVAVVRQPEGGLESALDRLVDADLLSRHGAPPHASYLFKHALVQDAAYSLLLREPRQALHARIAEAIENQFADMAAAEPEIVAHHYRRAELAGPACQYFERAGDRSVQQFAYAEAVAHFDAALAQAGALPPGPDRNQRELGLLLKQGPAIMTLKGNRGAEIEEIYQRAYELAETAGDEQRQFKALWGLWLSANVNRRTDVSRDRADELVALGKRSGREELVLEAIHCRWSTAFFRGDVAEALAGAREGLDMYDPARHSGLGAEFGAHDPGVCAHTVGGFALAQSGRPHEAAGSVKRAIALSRTLNQPPSISFAIMNSLYTCQMIGDWAAVARLASEMIELADRLDLHGPRSSACFMAAWARAYGDDLDAGLQAMEEEYPRVSVTGSIPVYYAGLLAGARIEAGQPARALELLDDVLKTVKEPNVGFYLPEIHRLRGECLLKVDHGSFDDAVTEFEAAIALAKQQQAHTFHLTAAIDLARAWSTVGLPEKGTSPLREAARMFTDEDVPVQLATAKDIISSLQH